MAEKKEKKNQRASCSPLHRRYLALLIVSLVCYAATFSFSGLLFHWFAPSGHDCSLNMFFIVMTLILVVVFAFVALHPKVEMMRIPPPDTRL